MSRDACIRIFELKRLAYFVGEIRGKVVLFKIERNERPVQVTKDLDQIGPREIIHTYIEQGQIAQVSDGRWETTRELII
jgi:hypothetical protein